MRVQVFDLEICTFILQFYSFSNIIKHICMYKFYNTWLSVVWHFIHVSVYPDILFHMDIWEYLQAENIQEHQQFRIYILVNVKGLLKKIQNVNSCKWYW